jgi:protein gp37
MATSARWSDLTGLRRPQKPWLNGLPRLIFISDMSDALSKAVSFEYLEAEIIEVVTGRLGRRHHWQWLTKRPGRMAEFSKWLEKMGRTWPTNLWAGTSITTQESTARIEELLKVGDENTTRFLSVEPQWEPIELHRWLPWLDWVIQGGQSGHRAKRFELEWAYDLLRQCSEAHVPYFLKQLGCKATFKGAAFRLEDSHGGDWTEWPEALRVRQMPLRFDGELMHEPGLDQQRVVKGRRSLTLVD